jgi:glycosyltransferase involved in cell wall biosynthesis
MRIAWIGPMPDLGGSAGGVGRQFLLELSRKGIHVDCYFPGDFTKLPDVLTKERNLKFFCQSSSWKWDRWYSRNDFMAFITGQLANLRSEMKLAKIIVRQHQLNPYDLVFQFSHIEMHALKRFKEKLPPIVLYPTTQHAAELKWHLKETHLSRLSESPLTRWLVRILLFARASTQKRHIKYAKYVIGQSKNFKESLCEDYNLPADKVPYIVANPINVQNYIPGPPLDKYSSDGRITLLFVSRISVRKGTELVVELSHRLSDLSDKVRILIIGNRTLWSDYRPLLNTINRNVATYISGLPSNELIDLYKSADALLVPSHFEPCGLVVPEALSCGLPVIASDKVGSAEKVNRRVCRVFPVGDMMAFEQSVRVLLDDIQTTNKSEISDLARHEAERLFSSSVIGAELASALEDINRKENDIAKVSGKGLREKMQVTS